MSSESDLKKSNVVPLKKEDRRVQNRAVQLFRFLRESVQQTLRPIYSIDNYEQSLFLSDIPRKSGCECIAWHPGASAERRDIWVELRKPDMPPPPPVPEPLESWINKADIFNTSLDFPAPRATIAEEIPESEAQALDDTESRVRYVKWEDRPDLGKLLDDYIEKKWWPWRDVHRELEPVQRVYSQLFSLYQRQSRLGESYEVVLGFGYLTWKTKDGVRIARHLITAQTSFHFDTRNGILTVMPSPEGAKPQLESDMIPTPYQPNPDQKVKLVEQASDIGDEVWDDVQVQDVLKAWLNLLSSEGRYENELARQAEILQQPIVHFAPALILRKRNERNQLRFYDEMIKQASDGAVLPDAIRVLVDERTRETSPYYDESAPPEEKGAYLTSPETLQIYFPKDANDAQLTIAQKIGSQPGVLVEGPPGTGKSHTIVNLVCHFLAHGKRIVVSSHTVRALKVLHSMFPDEIAPLCVSLLGYDESSKEALQKSVTAITTHYNTWNDQENIETIDRLEAQLQEIREEEAKTLNALRQSRERETYQHSPKFGGYHGTAAVIANRLRQEESRFSWLDTMPGENDDPPLSDGEAEELLALWRDVDPDKERQLETEMLDLQKVHMPKHFAEVVNFEKVAESGYEQTKDKQTSPYYKPLAQAPEDVVRSISKGLGDLIRSYENIIRHIQPWTEAALKDVLSDRDRVWRSLLEVTKEHLAEIHDEIQNLGQRKAELGNRDRRSVRYHAQQLLSHLESGGTLGWFGPLRPKIVREAEYLINEITIDGMPCRSAEALHQLLEYIDVEEHLATIRAHWKDHTGQAPTGLFTRQVADYQDLCEPLESILVLHKKVQDLRTLMHETQRLAEPVWHDVQLLKDFQAVAEAALARHHLSKARRVFKDLERVLAAADSKSGVHPFVGQLRKAVQTHNQETYADIYKKIEQLMKVGTVRRRRDFLHEKLRSVAPRTAEELASTAVSPQWDDRMSAFTAAWNWARADTWLRVLSDPSTESRLAASLEHLRQSNRGVMAKLIAAKAWRHCMSRLTRDQREHLMGWKLAMDAVRKGKGRHAERHRREARAHLEQCQAAIPAWVMPVHRVAETMTPGKTEFDVLIIDEASQSAPTDLFLFYLAKKVIVVGDDKQIRPEFAGLNQDNIENLRQTFIKDIPHSEHFGPPYSLFNVAQILYAERVRLREHFRCMPEIIQFSNNISYSDEPLIPLKQYGVGRVHPVVETVHVDSGYVEGKSPRMVNRPEALAVAERIKECCEDPRYDSKTFGVISLTGDFQAREIERHLLDLIGPEEMQNRDLQCGDAYAFQGAERDIIFLSLVAAPAQDGRRTPAQTSVTVQRRFNVAASRAKEQMWLFHSVETSDLSPNCYRYSLLKYCQNPKVDVAEEAYGIDPIQLRTLSQTEDRREVKPPPPFDSWFEVDVYLKVRDLGYNVVPQYEVAGKYIDLLIQGMHGRLGVECDGDFWHGPEQYAKDMDRERVLLRAGYQLVHIRESLFRRDPDLVFEYLLEILQRHKIFPAADEEETIERDKKGLSASAPGRSTNSTTKLDPTKTTKSGETLISAARSPAQLTTDAPVQSSLLDLKPPSANERTTTTKVAVSGQDRDKLEYKNWSRRPLPDPLTASRASVLEGLVDIIKAEGPMLALHAYQIYARAAGIQRVGTNVRSNLNKALFAGIMRGAILTEDEHRKRGQIFSIVRLPQTPKVIVRSLGNRTFEEIPPSEIAEIMRRGKKKSPGKTREDLYRGVLNYYGLVRVTIQVRKGLDRVYDRFLDND